MVGIFDRPPAFGKVSGKSVEGARTFSIRYMSRRCILFVVNARGVESNFTQPAICA